MLGLTITIVKYRLEFSEWSLILLTPDLLQNISYFCHTFVLQSFEGVDFRFASDVAVMGIVVFDALRAERFDAGGCWAEIGEGFPVVFRTGLFDEFGG